MPDPRPDHWRDHHHDDESTEAEQHAERFEALKYQAADPVDPAFVRICGHAKDAVECRVQLREDLDRRRHQYDKADRPTRRGFFSHGFERPAHLVCKVLRGLLRDGFE